MSQIMKISGIAITVGACVGLCVGIVLELINAIAAFLLPPLLVIMPACVVAGAMVGLIASRRPE